VPKYLQSDIVYSIKCTDCGDLYVGETKRQAIRRLWKHGAPKSLFREKLLSLNHETNNNPEDEDYDQLEAIEPTRIARQQVKKTSRIRPAPYPNPETLRRSTRVRNENQTNDTFHTNIIQINTHTEDRKNNNKNKKQGPESSISRHEQQTGHHMDWDRFKVVWQDSNSYKLLAKESLVIKAYDTPLNRTTHSVPMLVFPEGLPRPLIPDPNYPN
jgi:hypothetical protein